VKSDVVKFGFQVRQALECNKIEFPTTFRVDTLYEISKKSVE